MKLSPTMTDLLCYMGDHDGKINRHPGGFWSHGTTEVMAPWYDTTTIQALVARKLIEYSAWKKATHSQFPIEARMTADGWSAIGLDNPVDVC
jgi:hypothetical protein